MAVVTFTTDFGLSDAYVGAMKGVVLSVAPNAVLVDITHALLTQAKPGTRIELERLS
jgi:S-adenosyl-L-methionine hydrolase (adenosine-forming)